MNLGAQNPAVALKQILGQEQFGFVALLGVEAVVVDDHGLLHLHGRIQGFFDVHAGVNGVNDLVEISHRQIGVPRGVAALGDGVSYQCGCTLRAIKVKTNLAGHGISRLERVPVKIADWRVGVVREDGPGFFYGIRTRF